MPTLAITAIGIDRPGIVAAVTRVLLDHGCNLEDTAMSILRGQFAMVLVVDAPAGTDAAALEAALGSETAELDLTASVRELHASAATATAEGSRWTVVVYGPDHPGIVHLVAARLAAANVNILDVTTRVTEGSATAGSLYSMVMEVLLPPGLEPDAVEAALTSGPEAEGLTCRLHPADADVL
ncbi:MAG TPA: ACT domain-containing protein [Acidimicrobiales bacterium]